MPPAAISDRTAGSPAADASLERTTVLVGLLGRLFLLVMQLHPRGFRSLMGTDAQATFLVGCRRARMVRGVRGALAFTLVELLDLMRTGLHERFAPSPVGPRPAGPGRSPAVDNLLADLGFAVRSLRRRPAFVALCAVTLAIGIGASTLVFSVLDAVVLRPLPVREPDRLVTINQQIGPGTMVAPASEAAARISELADGFAGIAARTTATVVVTAPSGLVEQLTVARVSAGMFDLLGARPARGRTFLPEDAKPGAEPSAVLSYELAAQQFGDESPLGRTIEMDGIAYTVIGVMPFGFNYPYAGVSAWTPFALQPGETPKTSSMSVLARLPAGRSLESMRDELDRVGAALDEVMPGDEPWSLTLLPEVSIGRKTRVALEVMTAAAGLLLLIACANTANLILSQAAGRVRDTAIRAALGCGRARLVRQGLIESLLLGLVGGVLGVALAGAGAGPMRAALPSKLGFDTANPIDLDPRALGFAAAASLATVLLFGIIPAIRGSRSELADTLAAGGRGTIGGGLRGRRLLVAGQVGISLVLLVVAGLLAASFLRLVDTDLGFDSERLVAVSVRPLKARYPTGAEATELARRFRDRVAALPDISAAAFGIGLPPRGTVITFGIAPEAEGRTPPEGSEQLILPNDYVSAGYFATMRIPILEGREFVDADLTDSRSVVIVSESMARHFWGVESPLGRRFRLGPDAAWLTVVGIAGDVLDRGPGRSLNDLDMYQPWSPDRRFQSFNLMVRTRESASGQIGDQIRAVLAGLDPQQPLDEIATLQQVIGTEAAAPRFYMALVTGFAVIGLTLAAIGLYGVLTYEVGRRTREIGVRMAVGARSADLVRGVLASGLTLTVTGLVLGVAAAAVAGRFLKSMLYEVTALDPATYGGVSALLLVVAVAACAFPAARAVRVDPVVAIREE